MMKKEYVYMNFLINGHMEEYEIDKDTALADVKEFTAVLLDKKVLG